jgi:restriction endonuclease S subunit
VKVESDGFDLGAQRRPIERNDLPVVTHVIHMYQEQIQNSQDQDDTYHEIETVIDITKLRRNGEYNLSFERYVEIKNTGSSYPVRPLSEIVRIESGSRQKGGAISNGTPSIGGEQIDSDGSIRFEKMRYISDDFFMEMKHGKLQENDVLIVKDGATTGKMGFYRFKCDAAVNEHVYILRSNEAILPIYLYSTLKSHCFQRKLKPYIKGIIGGISLEFAEITIPVPPLDKQREIVAEIEGYQRIIDGARQVVENWKPNIEWELEEERRAAGVDAWPLVKLGEVCEKVVGGGTPSTANPDYWQGEIPWISSADIVDEYNANPRRKITEEAIRNSATNLIPKGNVVVVTRVGLGKLFLNSFDVCISQDSQGLIINKQVIFSPYLLHVLSQKVQIFKQTSQGSTIQGVTKAQLLSLDVPLPPMDRQRSIVSRIEAEKHVIDTNRALVEAYEERIRKVVERVWE